MDVAERLKELYDAERTRLLSLVGTEPPGAFDTPVFGEGNPAPTLLLIGEAPGAEETKQGRPFVGKAGAQLTALLTLMCRVREEIYITNAVKYRPVAAGTRGFRNRTPVPGEVAAGLNLLREEILLLRPRVVATLGNVPLAAAVGLFGLPRCTVGEVHGRTVPIAHGDYKAWLYPMYHPASTIYNRALVPVLEADAIRLGEML